MNQERCPLTQLVLFSILLISFLLPATPAKAEGNPLQSGQMPSATQASDKDAINFNLYIENDTRYLGGPGTDSAYTSGVRLSFLYAQNKEPKWTHPFPWLRALFEDHPYNFGMGVAQQLYTPEDLSRTELISNDRPYAGWLYISPTLTVVHDKSVVVIELDLGVVGPYALGEKSQNGVHRYIGAQQAMGWDHQLGTEGGVELSIQNKYTFFKLDTSNEHWRYMDVLPYYGEGFGNIYIGADSGAILRMGYNLPADYGPARPSAGDGDPFIKSEGILQNSLKRHWSLYLFGGGKMDIVARNIFLDGNTFQNSPRVTKVPLVGEYEAGFFVQFKKISVTWREVTRTPEFYENFKSHTFASLELSYGQRF